MTTTANHNPRGYAYTALKNAWNRQLSWKAFAAANKYGYYPTLGDYIDQGLDMFDRMYAVANKDIDAATAIIGDIIAEMGRSIKSDFKGHLTYREDSEGKEVCMPSHDIILDQPVMLHSDEASTIGADLPQEEQGYNAIEDADLMRTRMRIIGERINDEDMSILSSYVSGEVDTISAAFDGDYVQAMLFRRRMRAQLGSLQGSLVFG